MKDKYIMTIVGIQHYVRSETNEPDYCTRWIKSLQHGTPLTLVLDTHNPYATRCFAALMDMERTIGSLGCDYVEEAELLMDEDQSLTVWVQEGHHKCIDVYVDDPEGRLRQLADAPYQPRITTSALDRIPSPKLIPGEKVLQLSSKQLIQQFDNYIQGNQVPDEQLVEKLEKWFECYQKFYHKTLCREDHRIWKRIRLRLSEMRLDDMQQPLRQRFDTVWENFYDMHRHITQRKGCLVAMNHQLELLRQMALQPDGLIDQYQRVYLYDATDAQREAERQRIIAWLRAIPYNIYSLYSDRPELLASNIYYASFSRTEIYQIYAHMLVLEYLEGRLTPALDIDAHAPHPTSHGEVRQRHTALMVKMFRPLRDAGLLAGQWTDDFVADLWIRIFLDPIHDRELQTLRETVWSDIENMKSQTQWQGLKLNRPMEMLGYLKACDIVTGSASQVASVLVQQLKLCDLADCKAVKSRLRKYMQEAIGRSKMHDYTPAITLLSRFVK